MCGLCIRVLLLEADQLVIDEFLEYGALRLDPLGKLALFASAWKGEAITNIANRADD